MIVRSHHFHKLVQKPLRAHMQSDDDFQTTLSKWPFILGDVLLVATALAIAILGQWQLTNWQVASCVISVALGAGLFVLPYIVEFKVRVREEAEDRNADLRILQRQLVAAQDQLEAVSDRIESLEVGLANLAQAKPDPVDLSAPLAAMEGKIDPLRSAQAAQSSQLEALAKQVDILAKVIEAKPAPEMIQALQAELSALQIKFEELPPPVAEATNAEVSAEVAEVGEAAEPKAKKIREPRIRRTSEPRMLQRAIEQKQDKSSEAVSRIIKSEPKQEKAAKEVAPASEEPEAPAEPVVEEATVASAPKPDAAAQSKPDAPEPKESEESVKSEPEPEEASSSEPQATVEVEDMFGDAVPVHANKRMRTKKSDTAVIASVFIGIGNKPFVRGSGAGLNWESGRAMEFEEIGKWRWIVPADQEESVEIQLFRNDEDPDKTGKYTLEPGQKLELSPVF